MKINHTKISNTTKVSQGRDLTHSKTINCSKDNAPERLIRTVENPLKEGKTYNIITKNTIVETQCGKLLVINKPAHRIPVGKIVNG